MKIIKGIVMIGLTFLALGWLVPYLWPLVEDTLTNINNMSGGAGTDIIQMYWPILLVVTAICIGIAVIVYALRTIGLIGGKKND